MFRFRLGLVAALLVTGTVWAQTPAATPAAPPPPTAEERLAALEAYVNNGGTAVALRGPTYSIVAADTRLSTGYYIHTRDCSRVSQLTSQCAIATSGMHADTVALHKNLKSVLLL